MAVHKALVLTFSGMTDICAKEIKELTGRESKTLETGVEFETDNIEDLFILCYRSQTAERVLLVVSKGQNPELPEKYSKKTILLTGTSTRTAQALAEKLGIRQTYKNPETTLYLHSEKNNQWLCLDLTGDISKRDYRIFVGSETLKGPTAYALLRIAGCEAGKTLLDPFCRAGSIAIEAALFALQMPVRYYSKQKMPMTQLFKDFDFDNFFAKQDKKTKEKLPGRIIALSPQFPSVQATRKNAKIAGIVKDIEFSRTDPDWLDIKFGEQSTDFVITQPPEPSIRQPAQKLQKTINSLFERTKTILKKDGKTAIILRQGINDYITTAQKHDFRIIEQRTIMQGKEEWAAIIFSQK